MRGKCDKCGKIADLPYEFLRNELGPNRIHLELCVECGYDVKDFILKNHSLSETVKGEKHE